MDKRASEERVASSGSGFVYIVMGLAALLAAIALLLGRPSPLTVGVFVLGLLASAWCFAGLYMLQPNQAAC